VLALDGEYGEVDDILIEDRTQTMYNLTVDVVHTFAVGDGEWVVHNCDFTDSLTNSSKKGTPDEIVKHNKATLDSFEDGTGFSSVYDPGTNQYLGRPSGGATKIDGSPVHNATGRIGGHGRTNLRDMPKLSTDKNPIDTSQTVGFTIIKRGDELEMSWTSRGLNKRHNQNSMSPEDWLKLENQPNSSRTKAQAPDSYKGDIISVVEASTGLKVKR